MATETNNVIPCRPTFITTDRYYNGKTGRVSDFIIYFNIFGEFDNNVED